MPNRLPSINIDVLVLVLINFFVVVMGVLLRISNLIKTINFENNDYKT